MKLAGEEGYSVRKAPKSPKKRKEFFWARTKKERVAILLAGVTMNFILAVGITTYLLTQGTYEVSGRVHIETVMAGSPASIAGLMERDILQTISEDPQANNPKIITLPSDLIRFYPNTCRPKSYAHNFT